LDEDPKNELQVLSRIKDTVLLSTNGGRIVLNDDDPNNELQNLVINGDSITLTSSSKKISLSDLYRSSVSGKQVMAFRNLNDPIKNGLGWKWQMGTSWTTIDTIFAESNFVEYELKLQLKSSQGGAHSFRILDSKGSEVKVLDVNTDAPMWTNFGLDEIYKSNSFSVFDLYSGSSTGGDKECRVTIYIDQCIENEMYLFQMKSSSKSNPCDCLMPIRSRQTSYIH